MNGLLVLSAAGDCERIRDGFVAQPVNAASSLAYVVAGVAIVVRARDTERGSRSLVTALAVATAGNGVGGVAYHGPGGDASGWLHDVALVATVVVVAITLVSGWRVVTADHRRTLALAVTAALAVAIHATTRTDGPLCEPDSMVQGHAVWHVLTALLLMSWGRAVATRPGERSTSAAR